MVHASYGCQDGAGGPGIASCNGTVADGQSIDTTTPGRRTFTVTASSKDGQVSTSAIGYTVGQPDNHFSVSQIRLRRDGTVSFKVKVPGPGKVDVLETAWRDNLAQIAVQLRPAAHRFVFARAHRTANRSTTLQLRVNPNSRGRRLILRHTYRVTLRLWVTYAPTGGVQRKIGFYGYTSAHDACAVRTARGTEIGPSDGP